VWGTLLSLCFRHPVGRQAMHFLRSCRGTRRTRTLRSSLLHCGERPGGHPDVASGRCGAGAQFQFTCPAEPAEDREGDSPLPLQFVMPVSRTQALHLLNRGRVFYLRRRRDCVLRRGIGDAERCERVFRKRPQGARSEARAGPLRRRGGNIRSTASRTHRAMEGTAPLAKTKKVKTQKP